MFIKTLVIIILLLEIPLLAETKEPIALNDLTPQGSINTADASAISDRLRNELFKTQVFTVVERGQMQEVLKEQGFQQSGCTSDACAVEIGQLLGVKYIVVGSIAKVGATFTLNARIVDVATGKIVHTANSDCRCEIDDVLLKSTVEIANSLASSVRGPQLKMEQSQKKSRLGMRLSLAGGAVVGLIAGYYFNTEAQKKIDEANKNLSAYSVATTNDEYNALNSAYKDNIEQADKKNMIRNVLYGLAGVCAAGFTLTWAF